MINHINQYQ